MADLIDRKKIKAKFEPWLEVDGYSVGELNMLKAVLYEITVMPSVEAEPVRHGRWIKEPNCMYRCSSCGDHYPSVRGYMYYCYCPNCGARMDGEQDG